ncbi:MAG: hypothetical protein V1709_06540, partial [Planctomycetota bacterium]
WKEYPQSGKNKSGRDKAWRIWKRLKLEKQIPIIMKSLDDWKRCDKWLLDYIEGTHKWLNDGCWKDNPSPGDTIKVRPQETVDWDHRHKDYD